MTSRTVESEASTPLPYMADVGVISLVPDVWGGPWQPRHQVLTRLSRYFSVVWCNPARWWRKFFRHTAPWGREVDYDSAITPGFMVYKPAEWLPAIGRPHFLADWTMRRRLREAESILHRLDCGKTILYIWRPSYEPALDLIDYAFSCYHIDDEYTFSDIERPIDEREARLISRVDQVFIHSPGLLEKKGGINPNTTFVPNGVDYQLYEKAVEEPSDLAPIPHPRIGYTGILKRRLDWPLILQLTLQHPEWHFVFVGPQNSSYQELSGAIQQLSSRRNVHFLGAKSIWELAAYPQHMDVCILPYGQTSYSEKFIYPLKLHEYLASGCPVVGTSIRSLQEFAHIIRLARTTDEWSQALNDLLTPAARSAAQIEARRSIARQYDWNKLVGLIARTMCSRLGPSYLERFEKIPPYEGAAAAVDISDATDIS